jgi:hypothetical protein
VFPLFSPLFLTISVYLRAVAVPVVVLVLFVPQYAPAYVKGLSFEWSSSVLHHLRGIPPGTFYLICGLDPPFSPEESVCAEALPTFRDMQLIEQFSWAGRNYRIYERRA